MNDPSTRDSGVAVAVRLACLYVVALLLFFLIQASVQSNYRPMEAVEMLLLAAALSVVAAAATVRILARRR